MSGSLFDQYKAALRHGHLAALAGNLNDALDAYRAASRLVPERALPIASQGTVLHRLDRWPEAAEAFERALQLAPDDEVTLRARAAAREERGLRSGAAADLERLAFVLDVAGRAAEAVDAARRAAELEPSTRLTALVDRLEGVARANADRPPGGGPTAARDRGQVPAQASIGSEVSAETTAAIEPAAGTDAKDAAETAEAPEAQPEGADAAPVTALVPFDDGPPFDDAPPLLAQRPDAISAALAARLAELGTQPAWMDLDESPIKAALGELGPDGQPWPPVDLPSPPPPPIEGPPPDPEDLLSEAAALIAAGDSHAARDRMLTAVMVHREAGRLDAALEICLDLLSTAPGDPQVHLAIANLQLDRDWTGVATEKIELLVRLTSLTGDTQAEADVHGLASERLRDDPLSSVTGR